MKPDAQIAKGVTGTPVGNDIYNTTGDGQARHRRRRPGEAGDLRHHARNDGNTAAALRVQGAGSAAGYGVKYLSAGTDVTAAVVAGTFATGILAAGATEVLTARVSVKASAATGSSVPARHGHLRGPRPRGGCRPVHGEAQLTGSPEAPAMITASPPADGRPPRSCSEALVALPAPVAVAGGERAAFGYTGAPQTWTVPAGVHEATFELDGGTGGRSYSNALPSAGARVVATIAVTPGETLQIRVGGDGGNTQSWTNRDEAGSGKGGWNGGGDGGETEGDANGPFLAPGGGGATDVRRDPGGSYGLGTRILVAGGAGGHSYFWWHTSEDVGGLGGKGGAGTGAAGLDGPGGGAGGCKNPDGPVEFTDPGQGEGAGGGNGGTPSTGGAGGRAGDATGVTGANDAGGGGSLGQGRERRGRLRLRRAR